MGEGVGDLREGGELGLRRVSLLPDVRRERRRPAAIAVAACSALVQKISKTERPLTFSASSLTR